MDEKKISTEELIKQVKPCETHGWVKPGETHGGYGWMLVLWRISSGRMCRLFASPDISRLFAWQVTVASGAAAVEREAARATPRSHFVGKVGKVS